MEKTTAEEDLGVLSVKELANNEIGTKRALALGPLRSLGIRG